MWLFERVVLKQPLLKLSQHTCNNAGCVNVLLFEQVVLKQPLSKQPHTDTPPRSCMIAVKASALLYHPSNTAGNSQYRVVQLATTVQ